MADDHEIIEPPNTLKSKVKVGGPKAVSPEVLARAEAVITSLADEYLQWVEKDLVKIQTAWEALKASPDGSKPYLTGVYQVSHDIKGQGGSFGYQLMTIIGDRLCRFIEPMEKAGPREIEIIRLHIDAMRVVIAQKIEGEGGAIGTQLLKGLELVISKASK